MQCMSYLVVDHFLEKSFVFKSTISSPNIALIELVTTNSKPLSLTHDSLAYDTFTSSTCKYELQFEAFVELLKNT